MSRFVDRTAVERVELGPCACAGTPHDVDWAELRRELAAAEWTALIAGDSARALSVIVADWNLTDEEGNAVPRTPSVMADLDVLTFQVIDGWTGQHLQFPTLPNASGAPSRNGSKGSASRIQTIPKKR